MRYLGQAAFFLTFLAAGLAFVLSARRGWGPGRLLGESWPLMVLVAVLVLISMGAGWISSASPATSHPRRGGAPRRDGGWAKGAGGTGTG